ncbi:alkaline phosphatase family protein [Sneathiella marina]|uniref:Alkaline phosphatase family protein n=1 Tax=Sneathiella marina TaxID=2950108 RepID=A0ABY4W712_9PROT|nr:alkaline phosphatase family protein [Sneathiella marina]USG62975.1 alkaline phosphatase family protein [Sneathiella marina]
MSKPNVLFITIDQWRADSLGATGDPVIQTPVLDSLCGDGVVFLNHYSCSAPCGPSRATLHTGMYPSNHRSILNGTPLSGGLTNIAFEARKSGYDPILFGYTDTTPDPRDLGASDPAFRTYEGVLPGFTVGMNITSDCEPWLTYLRDKGYSVPGTGYDVYYPDPDFSLPADRHSTYAPARFKGEDSETAWLTDYVLKELKTDGDDPFFFHVSYLRPHPPFIATPELHDLYQPGQMKDPIRTRSLPEMAEQHPFLNFAYQKVRQEDYFMQGDGAVADLTVDEVLQIRATYKALVTEADQNIGRIISALKESGDYDDTLIVVTTDHGEQLGDHYLFGKLGFYDQSFHIPLIIKPPLSWGFNTGETVSAFTESVDIMPTILDGINQAIPRQCNGETLLPLLKGETPEGWRDAVHWLFDFRDPLQGRSEAFFDMPSSDCNVLVHRDEDFKYVHFANLPPLLFDMRNDPQEEHNLAEEPDYQAVVLHYVQKLLSWRMRHENSELADLITSDDGLTEKGAVITEL